MKTMAAGEFKTHCLSVLDEVRERGCEITITKRGKPVARVVPTTDHKPKSPLGSMKGRFEIAGDIVGPTVTPEMLAEMEAEWDEFYK